MQIQWFIKYAKVYSIVIVRSDILAIYQPLKCDNITPSEAVIHRDASHHLFPTRSSWLSITDEHIT